MAAYPRSTRRRYSKATLRHCCSIVRVGEKATLLICAGLMRRPPLPCSRRENCFSQLMRWTCKAISRRMEKIWPICHCPRILRIWLRWLLRASKAKMRQCSPYCCKNAALAGRGKILSPAFSDLWASEVPKQMPHVNSLNALLGCVVTAAAMSR